MSSQKNHTRKLKFKLPILLLGITLLLLTAGLWPYKQAIIVKSKNWQELSDIVLPHITVAKPDKAGPFPVVIVLPGCEGVYPERTQQRVDWLNAQGYMAVVVNSHKGRQLNAKSVCSGKALWGQERVGDVYIALDYVRTLPDADAGKIALLGYSHGGWTILDALSYDGAPSYGLTTLPENILHSVKGAVVYYPYCDFPSRAARDYNSTIPLLAFHAGSDSVVNPQSCNTMMTAWQNQGLPVTSVTYDSVEHGFDVASHRHFAKDTHQQALDEVAHFLQRIFL